MKKIILAVTILSLALSFTTAQEKGKKERGSFRNKKVQVTAETLAGKPYVIDLTRDGKSYEVTAGIDYSLVRVRTATGEVALSDMVKARGGAGKKFLLGTLNDLSAQNFGFPGGTSEPPDRGTSEADRHDVSSPGSPMFAWTCKGRRDCSDLTRSGKCNSKTMQCGTGSDGKHGCTCIEKQ